MDQVVKRFTIIFLTCLVAFWSMSALASQYVHGYTRSNGTYVRPYYRSSPNGTVTDNYSYRGNINPYTGAVGTNGYIHDRTSPYYQGPDSHGRVGHSGAPIQGEGYGSSNSVISDHSPIYSGHSGAPFERQGYGSSNSVISNHSRIYSDPHSVSLCPPPHYRMTEMDGCQAAR
jgi:hypothetical protein